MRRINNKGITLFLVLGLVAAMLLALAGCSSGSAASSSSSKPASSGEPANAASASAEKAEGNVVEFGGLSYQLPSGWISAEADNGGMYYYPVGSGRDTVIHVLEQQVGISPGQEQQCLNDALEGMLNSLEAQSEEPETQEYNIDGYPALRAKFAGDLNGSPYSFQCASVLHDGSVTMLACASPASKTVYDDEFAACIDSIKVIPVSTAASGSAGESANDAQQAESTKPAKPASDSDYVVTIDDMSITQDYDGEPVIIVTYSWVNNSDETTAAYVSLSEKAYQDGVELSTAYLIDGVDLESSQVDVKPGAGTTFQKAYYLRNTESPVEVEVTEWLDLDDKILTSKMFVL